MTAPANRLALEYLKRHPENAAKLLERRPAAEAVAVLEDSSSESIAAVIGYAAPDFGSECLNKLPLERRVAVLGALPSAFAAVLVRRMSSELRSESLSALNAEVRRPIDQALEFPENTVGSLMDSSSLVLPGDLSVEDALERLRALANPADSINFVVDRSQKMIGWVTAGRLLQADRRVAVASLALRAEFQPRPNVGIQTLIKHPSWVREEALPVVDEQGLFLGVVRREAVERIAQSLGAQSTAGHPAHPLLAVGELYWVGLCEFLGGLSSGQRSGLEQTVKPGGISVNDS